MAVACGVRTSRDQGFEFFHHGVGDFAAFFLGQRFLQRAALVHGSGGDDAAFVGDFFEAGEFARGKLHGNPPELQIEDECVELTIVNHGGEKNGMGVESSKRLDSGFRKGRPDSKMDLTRRGMSCWRGGWGLSVTALYGIFNVQQHKENQTKRE